MVEKIKEAYTAFEAEAKKAQDGNKAAGVRARKASLEIAKLLKEFRQESVKWGK